MIALDTETTGLDLRHGARPFLVTIATEDDKNIWWEWDVDPKTREVAANVEDLKEIAQWISEADEIALQNPKYDATALELLFEDYGLGDLWRREVWDWGSASKVRDTLLAGHLLASNQPHDLTTMVLAYLGINVQPYEDAVRGATKRCRGMAQGRNPQYDWRIAGNNLPEMPSAKGKELWKVDMWLPRAVVKEAILNLKLFDLLPDHPQQPVVGNWRDCTVRIDRSTKWGNPFRVGKDGTREEVIQKYARRIWDNNLVENLPELYEQVLGCHCSPKLCHGDVLRALCHPWMTVCAEYANSDSMSTLHLYKRMERLLKERGLWKIYLERLKVLPIICAMENRGISLSGDRLRELRTTYEEEASQAGVTCTKIAQGGYGYDLTLPKSGNNNSLLEFCFGRDNLDLTPYEVSKKTNKPSLNARCIEHYLATLEEEGKPRRFLTSLIDKRKRDTALQYMEGYRRFWLPLTGYEREGIASVDVPAGQWHVLHPSLNPTGTNTLRWSSSNPNEQNISKREGFNLRYCFGPAPGREWWSLDAKNIELRIPAYESGEQELIELFEHPGDPPYYGSTHLLNFHTIYPDIWAKELKAVGIEKVGPHCGKKYAATWYQWCKAGGFAVQYRAMVREDVMGTADKAFHRKGCHAKLKSRFAKLDAHNQWCIDYATKHGYIETMVDKSIGSDRGYPLLCTRNKWGRGILPTVPLNYRTQSTAMWWMQSAMIRCWEYLEDLNSRGSGLSGSGYYMILQVHDELVFDFPRWLGPKGQRLNLVKIRKIQKLMEKGGEDIGVPTPVSITYHSATWSEGVEV